jgi:putative MATE family efflux protein
MAGTDHSGSEEFSAPKQLGKPKEGELQGNFTVGPVHTHLVRLTGYMLMGFVSIMAAALIETIYIGSVGTNELAALSFTFPLLMVMQGVSMGLGIGASSVVARTMGRGDAEKARRLITHCFIMVITLILVISAVAYMCLEPFFTLLGAQPHILPLAVDYMTIWLLGMPFFAIAFVGSTLMRATGDAVTPGYLMTIGSALHIIIAPFFIFGLAGAPKLGLEGAALGFVLARTVSFVLYTYYIVFRDRLMLASLTGLLTSCREILHVGLPAVASNLIAPVSMSIITRLLASHGAEVVAGYGVASRIESIAMMVIIALSMSVAPFVGQNWGAGHHDRVKTALSLCNRFSILWGLFAFVMMILFGEYIVSLINEDPMVVGPAARYLVIVPISIGFLGITMTATQSFNALGKPVPPLIISILQMLVVYVPLALIGDYLWGYIGIFIAFTVTNIFIGILSWIWINNTTRAGSGGV